ACPKNLRPHAVDGHSCCKRVFWTNRPPGQRQPIERRPGGKARQKMWHSGTHALGTSAKNAAIENIGIRQGRRFLADQLDVAAFSQPVDLFIEQRKLSLERECRNIALPEVVSGHCVQFVLGPLRPRLPRDFRHIVLKRQPRRFPYRELSLIETEILKSRLP